jgi:hypothetical protein
VGVGVGVGVASGVGVGVGVGVAVGFATGTIFTPLFHTYFFPDLMQVYLIPLLVEVAPTLLQLCPAFTAAAATEKFPGIIRAVDIEIAMIFLPGMHQGSMIQGQNVNSW